MAEDFDMLAGPPAGHSLTQDNSKHPWGNPPQNADPAKAMSRAVKSLNEPLTRENMLKLMMAGVSVESLIEGYIFAGFQDGKFSLDTGLLMKGPLSLYMASLAEDENVSYRFFENDNALTEDELDDAEILKIMKTNNPNMYTFMKEKVNELVRQTGATPEVVDKGFLSFDNVKKGDK